MTKEKRFILQFGADLIYFQLELSFEKITCSLLTIHILGAVHILL